MIYRPPRARGVLFGSLLVAWAGLLAGLLVFRALDLPASLAAFLAWAAAGFLAALALLFACWTYAVASLHYVVDRNALAIQWGSVRQLVPLDVIQRLIPGRNVRTPALVSGINAPGVHVGHAEVERVGRTVFYSTHTNAGQLLYVVTPALSYGITIEDPAGFARAIQDRQGQATLVPRQAPLRSAFGTIGASLDPRAWGLVGAGLAAALALGGYVFWRFPALPPTMEFSFPPMGDVIRVASRRELLQIPLAALAVVGVNAVLGLVLHRLERMAAYLLWGAALAVQALFAVAVGIALA